MTRRRHPRQHRITLAAVLLAYGAVAGGGTSVAAPVPVDVEASILENLRPIPLETQPGASIPLISGGVAPGVQAFGGFRGAPPPFALPRGGRAVLTPEPGRPGHSRVSLYRDDGTPYASAGLSPDGRYTSFTYTDRAGQLVFLLDGTRAAPARVRFAKKRPVPTNRTRRSRLTAYCGQNFHADRGYVLGGSAMGFLINTTTVPHGGSGVNSILYGADNWNSHQDYCNIAEANNLQFIYQGVTNETAGLNGTNSVDFGSMPAIGCGNFIGCTLVWLSGSSPVQVDIRFNGAVGWNYTGGPTGGNRYDIEGVGSHEFGHAAGLNDVTSNGEVMYEYAVQNDTTNRRLGRGDASYINVKY